MKKILITAENSYIGNQFAKYTKEKYELNFISCRRLNWKKEDFSKYDTILHVAGIAHNSTDQSMKEEYYKVNTELTIELAKKAKAEGVSQFIFLSSIIVYGENYSIKKPQIINAYTEPNPTNFYGDSKLKAEKAINSLQGDSYKVAIIRPPMVYGDGAKGNFQSLLKIAKVFPVFPNIDNKRSMIHVENLANYIMFLIDNKETGTFFPQDKEYINTSLLVKKIRDDLGYKLYLTKLFNPIIYFFSKKINIINKAFGSLVYEKELSHYKQDYQKKKK